MEASLCTWCHHVHGEYPNPDLIHLLDNPSRGTQETNCLVYGLLCNCESCSVKLGQYLGSVSPGYQHLEPQALPQMAASVETQTQSEGMQSVTGQAGKRCRSMDEECEGKVKRRKSRDLIIFGPERPPCAPLTPIPRDHDSNLNEMMESIFASRVQREENPMRKIGPPPLPCDFFPKEPETPAACLKRQKKELREMEVELGVIKQEYRTSVAQALQKKKTEGQHTILQNVQEAVAQRRAQRAALRLELQTPREKLHAALEQQKEMRRILGLDRMRRSFRARLEPSDAQRCAEERQLLDARNFDTLDDFILEELKSELLSLVQPKYHDSPRIARKVKDCMNALRLRKAFILQQFMKKDIVQPRRLLQKRLKAAVNAKARSGLDEVSVHGVC